MTLAATVRTRSFVLFLRITGRGYENPYLLKRLLDITVILLKERLIRKGGNGLKVVTQAAFHRVRIPHDNLIKAKKRGRLFARKVDLGHRLQKDIGVFAQTRGQRFGAADAQPNAKAAFSFTKSITSLLTIVNSP